MGLKWARHGGESGGRIRWLIARFLDRFDDTCWASLALWALFPENHSFEEVFEMRNTAGRCAAHGEAPYCGKCGRGAGCEG